MHAALLCMPWQLVECNLSTLYNNVNKTVLRIVILISATITVLNLALLILTKLFFFLNDRRGIHFSLSGVEFRLEPVFVTVKYFRTDHVSGRNDYHKGWLKEIVHYGNKIFDRKHIFCKLDDKKGHFAKKNNNSLSPNS